MADLTADQQFQLDRETAQRETRLLEIRNQCLDRAISRALPGASAETIVTDAQTLYDFVEGA